MNSRLGFAIANNIKSQNLDLAAAVLDYSPDLVPEVLAGRMGLQAADSVAAIIATGQAVIDAKKALPHGQFERLFANHADPLPEPVACTPQTAQKLMAIARHSVIAKAAQGRALPTSWTTLYELTKLPEDKLGVALSEGWVRPETQRADAKKGSQKPS